MSLLTKEAAGAKVSTVFKHNLQTWQAEKFLNFIVWFFVKYFTTFLSIKNTNKQESMDLFLEISCATKVDQKKS